MSYNCSIQIALPFAVYTFSVMLSLPQAAIAIETNETAITSPNIILFLADDMGLGDTSAYQDFTGNSDADQIDTPNMERLARMGVRLSDAHTPASRCSPTRYAVMTGRYAWRNRLKYWVLFGSQGDPMIERDRPTIATMLKGSGYRTAMFGKWHVGLRYRQSNGKPAAGWNDADLTKDLYDTPVDHGFDIARFTSRSHGTSGPDVGQKKAGKKKKDGNTPNQSIGPGHIHNRTAVGATKDRKRLIANGENAYILKKLGSRHSDHAIEFLTSHIEANESRNSPFFLYYPSNSNHGPYTPDQSIGGKPVAGASRNKLGQPMNVRSDYVYENDVALGRLIDFLITNDDPRNPGHKLINNTLVIFTSDNGAERASKISTGPFRSNKGSCYEGGHRVPFIAAWKTGRIGDGDVKTAGKTIDSPIGLQDLFATFAEMANNNLPDLSKGEKGAEDSVSALSVLRGEPQTSRPMFYHDHKESKDAAVVAMRLDVDESDDGLPAGQWKILFDAKLLRLGFANPTELYNLRNDSKEANNLINESEYRHLAHHLTSIATTHRNLGGHRYAKLAVSDSIILNWTGIDKDQPAKNVRVINMQKSLQKRISLETTNTSGVNVTFRAKSAIGGFDDGAIVYSEHGVGLAGGTSRRFDNGEELQIHFDRDVIIESAAILAGENGTCGGFYRVGDKAPLAIYCVDADNDSKDQSGVLSDIGLLKAGETLTLSSAPHYGVEAPGSWNLSQLQFRVVEQ